MVEDDIKGEVVLHPTSFFFFYIKKEKSSCEKPVSINLKSEVVLVHDDFTFIFILVSKKENIFGKKKFSTRAKFHEKGRWHEISIECKNKGNNNGESLSGVQPKMEIRIDGHLVIHVKHLQWKFRSNQD